MTDSHSGIGKQSSAKGRPPESSGEGNSGGSKSQLEPEVVKLKLRADDDDGNFDSGVFLRAGSFDLGGDLLGRALRPKGRSSWTPMSQNAIGVIKIEGFMGGGLGDP